jgi:hypothetical protein
MRVLVIAALGFMLASCAAAPPRPPLIASAGAAPAAEMDAVFRQSLALRYGTNAGRDAVRADLAASDFACVERAAPIGAPPDAVIDVCTRTRPAAKAGCTDAWTVDLRFRNLSRALDSVRIAPVGRFARSCR